MSQPGRRLLRRFGWGPWRWARKPRMAPLAAADIPEVISLGRKLQQESGLDYSNAGGVYADKTRGGSIPVPMVDPALMKARG